MLLKLIELFLLRFDLLGQRSLFGPIFFDRVDGYIVLVGELVVG
jgi:hypothetical protein